MHTVSGCIQCHVFHLLFKSVDQTRQTYHEVSKLLGHSSVTKTERHYAPLLATEIDDFFL